MSYTIVGMFPDQESTENAKNHLRNIGFEKEDYTVSDYKHDIEIQENEVQEYIFEEDEKTTGFWDWLFGANEDDKRNYSYAGTKNTMLTVYADDLDKANEVKIIMNNDGAINVSKFAEEYVQRKYSTENKDNLDGISEEKRARVIAKAKNDLYFTDTTRNYKWRRGEGMTTDMDSLGNKDEN